MKISKFDLGYIAGLLDGEGTITLTKMQKNKSRVPVVSITMTEKGILEWIQEIAGGSISKITKKQKHWKQAWTWKISHRKALDFIHKVGPYLKETEKSRRATILINDYKKVTPRNGKYTEETLLQKEKMVENFFKDSSKTAF